MHRWSFDNRKIIVYVWTKHKCIKIQTFLKRNFKVIYVVTFFQQVILLNGTAGKKRLRLRLEGDRFSLRRPVLDVIGADTNTRPYIDRIIYREWCIKLCLIESMMVFWPRQGNQRQVFRLFSLMLGKDSYETNSLKTRLNFPCRGLNTIIDYFSHTSFSAFPQQEHEVAVFLSVQRYKNAVCKIAASQTDWKEIETLFLPTLY